MSFCTHFALVIPVCEIFWK